MIAEETELKGCFTIVPSVFEDARGYFYESYNASKFRALTGLHVDFIQDNESFSSYGVVRGLHMQQGAYAQAKLVRVIRGEVLDVVVDARKGSPTFGKHFSVILNGNNKKQLFIPRGFLHGFSVLENETILSYKCDNFYNKSSELGVLYNDPDINIDWNIPEEEVVVSDKDRTLFPWKDFIYHHTELL